MGFRCEKCTFPQGPRKTQHRVVVETREKHYPYGGVGWEIAKEMRVCAPCAEELRG